MRRNMAADYNHRDAIAAIDAAELARLKETSDRPAFLRLSGHLGLLLLTGLAVLNAPSWPLWMLAMLAHGIALSFLFTLEHEAIHGTAFRTPWLNSIAAELAGFPLLLPPRHFRYFHFAHHRFTQDAARDPELASPKPANWRDYLIHLSGFPYWRAQVANLFNHALGRRIGDYVPANGRGKVIAEARATLIVIAGFAALAGFGGWSWPLELWIVPALLGQPFLRAFLLAEHAACPLVEDMLVNSRTTFASAAIRFLGWNMPFHTAHHVLPVVPFHRLPALTVLLRDRLGVTARGYLGAHQQFRASWRRGP
jgi:fatty acid desaturase